MKLKILSITLILLFAVFISAEEPYSQNLGLEEPEDLFFIQYDVSRISPAYALEIKQKIKYLKNKLESIKNEHFSENRKQQIKDKPHQHRSFLQRNFACTISSPVNNFSCLIQEQNKFTLFIEIIFKQFPFFQDIKENPQKFYYRLIEAIRRYL